MKKLRWQNGQEGFTLVEILVSAVVMGIFIIALVAMIQKGREMDYSTDHHRQARALIHAAFERPEYHFDYYNAISAGTETDTVTLDPDDNPKTGYLEISVTGPHTENVGGTGVPYKEVTMSLWWNEVDGSDTVSVTKRISKAR